MIQINPNHAKAFLEVELCGLLDAIDGEYILEINDVDELHDYTLASSNICVIDRVYDALCSILPIVLDDCIVFVEEEQDMIDFNPRREFCDADFYGI